MKRIFIKHAIAAGIGLLLTLLREYPNASGVGLEVSEEALAVAQANAEALGVAARARLISGDWRQADWQQRLEPC